MIKIKKNSSIQELTKMVGIDNIAFTYCFEKKHWFSCTCGYLSPEKDNAFYDEDGRYVRKCPACGTHFIIEDINYNDESSPVLFNHKIIFDNERFAIMKFKIYALDFSNDFTSPSITTITPDDILAYDKKEKMLFFAEDDWWGEWWKMDEPASYSIWEEEPCICIDGSHYPIKVSEQDDDAFLCFVHDDLFEPSGLKSIATDVCTLANRMDLMDDIPECCGLSEMLNYLILYINCPWMADMDEKLKALEKSKQSGVKDFMLKATDNFWNTYFELKKFGLCPNAETVEQAWMSDINQLACICLTSRYKKMLSMMDNFDEATKTMQKLSQSEIIPTDKWEGMLRLIKDSGLPAEQVIKYVRNGIHDGYSADTIISECFKNMDDDGNIMVDFNRKFSSESIRKREIVESGIMSSKQYDMIAENPTAENVLATLNI